MELLFDLPLCKNGVVVGVILTYNGVVKRRNLLLTH